MGLGLMLTTPYLSLGDTLQHRQTFVGTAGLRHKLRHNFGSPKGAAPTRHPPALLRCGHGCLADSEQKIIPTVLPVRLRFVQALDDGPKR